MHVAQYLDDVDKMVTVGLSLHDSLYEIGFGSPSLCQPWYPAVESFKRLRSQLATVYTPLSFGTQVMVHIEIGSSITMNLHV